MSPPGSAPESLCMELRVAAPGSGSCRGLTQEEGPTTDSAGSSSLSPSAAGGKAGAGGGGEGRQGLGWDEG